MSFLFFLDNEKNMSYSDQKIAISCMYTEIIHVSLFPWKIYVVEE